MTFYLSRNLPLIMIGYRCFGMESGFHWMGFWKKLLGETALDDMTGDAQRCALDRSYEEVSKW